ncbi:DoxX family protein [Corynebacterium heidelbergense]|uniref:DoxX family protein n=1 Tax=Corynebacterium heidelbergense TaxID=2055947 RepID=A0A364VBP6_9CORY|nr:DoxX family protein [Corynebacterium heidelbergense]RAV34041.1 hypothetical protein CWC39_05410 [Corynebacterium heidelbergense]WCZ36440.1 DoxX [Corynebacterium heidelbergense]
MIRTLARPLLASAFALDGAQMLTNSSEYTDNAKAVVGTLRGVLPPNVATAIPKDPEKNVRIIATTKLVASAMLATGKKPRLAAATLAAIQLPTTVARHAFWTATDSRQKKEMQRGAVADMALLGALAITTADTQGKPGLAWRVQKALPGKTEQEKMVANAQEQAQELFHKAKDGANQASTAVASYVDDHSDEWKSTAAGLTDKAKVYAAQASDVAQDYAEQASGVAKEYYGEASKQTAKARKQARKAAKKQAKKLK